MKPPRELLEGADLLAYVTVPESATFTGRLNLYVDDERLGRVACLAICRPCDDPGLLLLHCDAAWEMLGVQAWNAPGVVRIVTIEEMMKQAERYYEGLAGRCFEPPFG
jgi:hypothetical protein